MKVGVCGWQSGVSDANVAATRSAGEEEASVPMDVKKQVLEGPTERELARVPLGVCDPPWPSPV